jgi:hypothetical protein
MGGRALQEYPRSHMRQATRRIKPVTRGEAATQQHERLLRQFIEINGFVVGEAVPSRHHRQSMNGIERTILKPFVIDRHDAEAYITSIQAARKIRAALLDELDLDGGVAASIANQKP